MLTEPEVLEILRSGEVDLTPLTVQETVIEPGLVPRRPDVALRLSWGDWSAVFAGEIIGVSTPKALEGALAQARRYGGADVLPLVITPYLSPESLRRCLDEEVSAFDLGGNAAIVVPGRVAVCRTGAPNQYPASRDIKSIYRGKSSLVPRVFLLFPRFELVGDILTEIRRRGGDLSLGTVSKVLKGLEDDLVVRKQPSIEVLQAGRLLDRLVENYAADRVKPRTSADIKLDLSSDSLWKLRRACDQLELRCVGASLGPDDPVPDTGIPNIYVEDLDRVMSAMDLSPVPRFGTVTLLESTDLRVYFDRRDREGFFWSSPLQRYLELAVSGKRERELGAVLRDSILGRFDASGGLLNG